MEITKGFRDKVYGMFLGAACGDAIGSCFEFKGLNYIGTVATDDFFKKIRGSEVFGTIPGQVTDDTEMAISLLNALQEKKGVYDRKTVLRHYQKWLFDTHPFDCGNTISSALYGQEKTTHSESNGALMRCFPLALAVLNLPDYNAIETIVDEAQITHLNRFVLDCNIVFLMTLRHALTQKTVDPKKVYEFACGFVKESSFLGREVRECVLENQKPESYVKNIGWCKIAFQNSFWQLTHAKTPKEAIVSTVREGGDTDTNAAICGAMMGAVYGESMFPENWRVAIQGCRPDDRTRQPRPRFLWFNNYQERAERIFRYL